MKIVKPFINGESKDQPCINQKQYKQFSLELFQAYIDKFSHMDKMRAFDLLAKEMKMQYTEIE